MANTFTVDVRGETVFGDQRVRMGTLTMTDGGGGSSVASGFGFITKATVNLKTKSTTAPHYLADDVVDIVINSNVNGDFKVPSAVSGAAYDVVVYGR